MKRRMAPAVADAPQVRAAIAAVGIERDGDFFDAQLDQGALNDHLAGHLHAGHLEAHLAVGGLGEAAHPAVRIADAGLEDHVEEPTQAGVSDPTVVPGHGAGLDLAGEAIAHDQIGAAAKRGEESLEVGEIVALVAVGHDDVAAGGFVEAAAQRVAVAAERLLDHSGAGGGGQSGAVVDRAVVDDDHLAGCRQVGQRRLRLPHAGGHGPRLVEARHDDGDLDRIRRRHAIGSPPPVLGRGAAKRDRLLRTERGMGRRRKQPRELPTVILSPACSPGANPSLEVR